MLSDFESVPFVR